MSNKNECFEILCKTEWRNAFFVVIIKKYVLTVMILVNANTQKTIH